jgi:hypothetical protein
METTPRQGTLQMHEGQEVQGPILGIQEAQGCMAKEACSTRQVHERQGMQGKVHVIKTSLLDETPQSAQDVHEE